MLITLKHDTRWSIRWQVNYECNYHCSYCSQRKSPVWDEYRNFKYNYIGIAENLNKMIKQFSSPITLRVMGGEFSIIPIDVFKKCISIISHDNSRNLKLISLTTNLSRDLEYYVDLIKSFPELNFKINTSFHETECTFSEFSKKIKELKELKNCRIDVLFVVNSSNVQFINELDSLGVRYTLLEEHDESQNLIEPEPVTKSANLRKILLDGSETSIRDALVSFKKSKLKECHPSTIRVMPNGDINLLGCSIRDNVLLGNIYEDTETNWENFLENFKIYCKKDTCQFCHIYKLYL